MAGGPRLRLAAVLPERGDAAEGELGGAGDELQQVRHLLGGEAADRLPEPVEHLIARVSVW